MSKKTDSGFLNTALIVGGIGLAAYLISKSMPQLPGLGGDGVSISSPIDFSLEGLGLDGLLPTGLPVRPGDETESGCTPLGLIGGGDNWIQDIIDRLGLGEKEAVIIDPLPDIVIDPTEISRGGVVHTVDPGIINIGGESWSVTPQILGLNMDTKELAGRIAKMLLMPFGLWGAVANKIQYGGWFVDYAPEDAPVCEGPTCAASGWQPFFLPQDVGGQGPAVSESPSKPGATTTPTVYAPAAPAITGGGGEKKELYIL